MTAPAPRACPRCPGRLLRTSDGEWSCLSCGFDGPAWSWNGPGRQAIKAAADTSWPDWQAMKRDRRLAREDPPEPRELDSYEPLTSAPSRGSA